MAAKTKKLPVSQMIYMVQWASWQPASSQTWTVHAGRVLGAKQGNKYCPQSLRNRAAITPSKAPVSSTSCPAPCCLNREFTPGVWRGDKPMRATSNLIMWQPKTYHRLDWPHLQLWWCPQTQTLQLLHSTSYNWNHNLTPKSVRNGPALLLKFINCLNPPEMENSEF